MNNSNLPGQLKVPIVVGSGDLLAALRDTTHAHQEELKPQIATMSPEWKMALAAVCTESFESGFREGVAYMEERAANSYSVEVSRSSFCLIFTILHLSNGSVNLIYGV